MLTAVDPVDIDDALGTMINLSGKMRMLSHRTALFAMMGCDRKASTPEHLVNFEDAAREFGEIFQALLRGKDSLGIPARAAQALAGSRAMDETITTPIESFLAQVEALGPKLQAGAVSPEMVERLVDLVAGDLLVALNRLTIAVSATLKARIGSRQAQTEQARAAMLRAVGSISEVSMKVKLISLNATIEAARAGPYGKSFGVIAAEIRALSEDAARSAQGLRDQVERSA